MCFGLWTSIKKTAHAREKRIEKETNEKKKEIIEDKLHTIFILFYYVSFSVTISFDSIKKKNTNRLSADSAEIIHIDKPKRVAFNAYIKKKANVF